LKSSPLGIGDAAAWAGVATSTLRYWEDLGLLRPARRAGRRVYDDAALDRMSLVLLAQRAGFTLAEIRQLLAGFSMAHGGSGRGGRRASAGERWRALVGRKQAEVTAKIDELRRMLDVLELLERCECPDLDACGAASRRQL
jgi:MerR family redox-sensitive transcriptional activator SoxR